MKNKTNTYLILVTLIAIAATGGFSYAVRYISGLAEKTSELKTEIESKEIKIRHVLKTNKSAEKTSEDRIKLMQYFVKANGAIDFVSALEAQASNFSLKYNTNSIDNTETDALSSQGKQLLKISMSLSGSWKNIVKFITYVESLPYALNIEKAQLTSEGIKDVNESLDTSITSAKVVVKESVWNLLVNFSVITMKDRK
jgi:Tfp pilus assembly protein PilO